MNVAALDPRADVREKITDLFAEMLERAKAGEFDSAHVMAMNCETKTIHRESAGLWSIPETVGQLEMLKLELLEGGRE